MSDPTSHLGDQGILDSLGIGAAPSVGGGATGLPGPIGVPPVDKYGNPWAAQIGNPNESYVPLHGRETSNYHTVQPTFYEGDQYRPATLGPAGIADLQRAMIAAGLIDASDIQLGVWDGASIQGYEKLLGYANMTGLTSATAALAQWSSLHDKYGASAKPLTVQLSNPDELRQVFRAAVIGELGQGWDSGKIDAMVASYQQTERDYAARAQQVNQAGGEITAPPSPEAYAKAQAMAQDPTGVAAHDYLEFVNQFHQLVGQWQG